MIFRNKITLLIILPFAIVGLLCLPYILPLPDISYKIFAMIGAIWSLVVYFFVIFDYYKIEEEKIVFVSWLGMKRKEAFFSEIKRIYVYPFYANGLIKAIRVEYGILGCDEIVVNNCIKNYKKLIKIVIEKSQCTHNVLIDNKVLEIIK